MTRFFFFGSAKLSMSHINFDEFCLTKEDLHSSRFYWSDHRDFCGLTLTLLQTRSLWKLIYCLFFSILAFESTEVQIQLSSVSVVHFLCYSDNNDETPRK
jgi:hypothetical protein